MVSEVVASEVVPPVEVASADVPVEPRVVFPEVSDDCEVKAADGVIPVGEDAVLEEDRGPAGIV
ncbi:MAG TPA: hypothetical protein VIL27_01270 [Clostridia bacterium]